ncbi:MAG TPA: ChbG/HpnK family deacetylase [Accumulibacter sp.]|uniref:ChbG/HpnK family deacetylase n=1 Tax=Accumulibacter sp. TaxID=2053492 RepID=UPI002C86DEB5|nr:ChbG/HpnK family deacetylase [Accumulibacter sp.]HMW79710.1 ChbG/HpnK family deacetylase [Accumulibacter sp.]
MTSPPVVVAHQQIILCADDFGLSREVNDGIIRLAESGRLSAVSCLTTAEFFEQQAGKLADLPIDRGLHLNLTEPLAGNAFCQPLTRLIRNAWTRRLAVGLLAREVDRQLDAFEAACGAPPDYIDGHQHVHQFPTIRECLIARLQRRYPGYRPWLRCTRPARLHPEMDWPSQLKAHVIGKLGARRLKVLADAAGYATNTRLLGVYGLAGGEQRYARLLAGWLACAAGGDLLMCHPAAAATHGDPLGEQRWAEYRALADDRLPSMLARHRLAIGRPLCPRQV